MATKPQTAFPGFDFAKTFGSVPSFDYSAFVASSRKNVEALTEAGKLAFEGYQVLAQQGAKLLQDAVGDLPGAAARATDPHATVDLVKSHLESTVSKLQELGDVAAKSQADAAAVIQKRLFAGIEELKGLIPSKAS